MSFLSSLRAAFKGGAQPRVPLAPGFASPWGWAFEPGGTRLPFEYRSAVRHGYLDNPVAQRAVRLVAEGVGAAPLAGADDEVLALVAATSAGQSLLETLAAHLLLHGNAFVQIAKDGAGKPVELFALRPERVAGQAQKEFYVNEAHALADALLHAACEGEAAEPPSSPTEGESWLVSAGASGDWSGEDGKLAAYQSGTWLFVQPNDGMRLFDRTTGQVLLYRGGWQRAAAPAEPSAGSTVDAEARTAIADLIAALVDAGVFPSS
jgi:hypothetical protein